MCPILPLKFVAIGGGTGLSTLLRGLKPHLQTHAYEARQAREPQIDLTAIITVTDDGKSSGRLRGEFGVLPPGDIRNCLVALADEEKPLTRLFRHRFPGDGPVGGHALGNLIILALNQMNGCFLQAVDQARELLEINACLLPSTLDHVSLMAEVGGKIARGQVAIKTLGRTQGAPLKHLALAPAHARALPEAVEAILAAELITLGPGSLFTSIIANLLVPGIAAALAQSQAIKIYICNAMTEYDETDGLTAADHVRQLCAYAPGLKLDYALFNSTPISAEMRERYAAEKAVAIEPPTIVAEACDYQCIALPLASEARFVRHDPVRLSRAIFNIYQNHSNAAFSRLNEGGVRRELSLPSTLF
jgi:uncharacterized cofD-like protein